MNDLFSLRKKTSRGQLCIEFPCTLIRFIHVHIVHTHNFLFKFQINTYFNSFTFLGYTV